SRDSISICSFIGTQHALGPQTGISIWETMMATKLIDMGAVKGQPLKGTEALLVQLLSAPLASVYSLRRRSMAESVSGGVKRERAHGKGSATLIVSVAPQMPANMGYNPIC